MKIIEAIDSKLSQVNDPYEKYVLDSTINTINILYIPSKDEDYNTRHLFECLIVSSITHLLFIEVFNPINYQRIKEFIFKRIEEILIHSEPIPFFDERDNGLTYFDKCEIIGLEISRYGKNRQYFPAKFLQIVYNEPLNFNLAEIETIDADYPSTKEEIYQLQRFIEFINQLKKEYIPKIIENQKNHDQSF